MNVYLVYNIFAYSNVPVSCDAKRIVETLKISNIECYPRFPMSFFVAHVERLWRPTPPTVPVIGFEYEYRTDAIACATTFIR